MAREVPVRSPRHYREPEAAPRLRSIPWYSPPRDMYCCPWPALTGYTVKAIQRKIERGDWPEGKVWRHAPDGHVVVDMMGYERWVEGR